MKKPKILVVEDNVINQKVIKRMIETLADVEVETAESGEKALTLLESESYQLVLMDIQLDGMDGLETTREIRRMGGAATLNSVPVVMLSGYTDSAQSAAAKEAGATQYLLKPVESDELKAVLEMITSPSL